MIIAEMIASKLKQQYAMDIIVKVLNTEPTVNDGNNKNNLRTAKNIATQKCFVICESCFWCASAYVIYGDERMTSSRCPRCNNNDTLNSIPLSDSETCTFDYSPKRGLTLQFGIKSKSHSKIHV